MVLINKDGTNETISFDDVNFNGNAAEESSNLQAQQGGIKEFKVLKNAVIPTQEGNYLDSFHIHISRITYSHLTHS